MKNYKIFDDWIELTEGPYVGTVYKYGRVNLVEEDDTLRIQFEYHLLDGTRLDDDFVQYIGPILEDLINEGVINNSIVYCGGLEEQKGDYENRGEDS